MYDKSVPLMAYVFIGLTTLVITYSNIMSDSGSETNDEGMPSFVKRYIEEEKEEEKPLPETEEQAPEENPIQDNQPQLPQPQPEQPQPIQQPQPVAQPQQPVQQPQPVAQPQQPQQPQQPVQQPQQQNEQINNQNIGGKKKKQSVIKKDNQEDLLEIKRNLKKTKNN